MPDFMFFLRVSGPFLSLSFFFFWLPCCWAASPLILKPSIHSLKRHAHLTCLRALFTLLLPPFNQPPMPRFRRLLFLCVIPQPPSNMAPVFKQLQPPLLFTVGSGSPTLPSLIYTPPCSIMVTAKGSTFHNFFFLFCPSLCFLDKAPLPLFLCRSRANPVPPFC